MLEICEACGSALKAVLRPLRNGYYRIFPRLRYRVTGKKRILLYVNNHAMTSHIQRYAQPLLSDPAYAFFLYYPDFPIDRKSTRLNSSH